MRAIVIGKDLHLTIELHNYPAPHALPATVQALRPKHGETVRKQDVGVPAPG